MPDSYVVVYRVKHERAYTATDLGNHTGLLGVDVLEMSAAPATVPGLATVSPGATGASWTLLSYWDSKGSYNSRRTEFEKALARIDAGAHFLAEGDRRYEARPKPAGERVAWWEIQKLPPVAAVLSLLGFAALIISGVWWLVDLRHRVNRDFTEPQIAFIEPASAFTAVAGKPFTVKFTLRNIHAENQSDLEFKKLQIESLDGDSAVPVVLDPLTDTKIPGLKPRESQEFSVTGKVRELTKLRKFKITIDCAAQAGELGKTKTFTSSVKLNALPAFSYEPFTLESSGPVLPVGTTRIYAGEKFSRGLKLLVYLGGEPGVHLVNVDMIGVDKLDRPPLDNSNKDAAYTGLQFTTPYMEPAVGYQLRVIFQGKNPANGSPLTKADLERALSKMKFQWDF